MTIPTSARPEHSAGAMSSARVQDLLAACDQVFDEVADVLNDDEASPRGRDGWRLAGEDEPRGSDGDEGDEDDEARGSETIAEDDGREDGRWQSQDRSDNLADADNAGERVKREFKDLNADADGNANVATAAAAAEDDNDDAGDEGEEDDEAGNDNQGQDGNRKPFGRETLLTPAELEADSLLEAIASKRNGHDEPAQGPSQQNEVGYLEVPLDIEAYWLLQEMAWEEAQDEDDDDEDGDDKEDNEDNEDNEAERLQEKSNGKDLGEGAEHAKGVQPESTEPEFTSFSLRVIGVAGRTGFEETKELRVHKGMRIAGRYEVEDVVGEAAFSTALRCIDTAAGTAGRPVCCKVIKNSKDFVDQSLDEIRLLKHLNERDPEAAHVVQLLDFFYHKEHLFLVTELLGANLFAGWRNVLEALSVEEAVWTVAMQCLSALEFVHASGLIHCDIKPENILVASLSPLRVKLIDFGSSCFATDRLSSYIQSRFYRAPEVVLGLSFDARIDLWSLGCVLAELRAGQVLFECADAHELLALIVSTLGPVPRKLLRGARFAHKFFVGNVLHRPPEDEDDYETPSVVSLFYPRRSSLVSRLPAATSPQLLHLLSDLLTLDPSKRSSARELLSVHYSSGESALTSAQTATDEEANAKVGTSSSS